MAKYIPVDQGISWARKSCPRVIGDSACRTESNGEGGEKYVSTCVHDMLISHKFLQFCAMCKNAAYTKRNYRPFQTHESALLMRDVMDDPQTYKKHYERFATSLTFSVAYGNRIVTLNDPLLKENRVAGSAFAATM